MMKAFFKTDKKKDEKELGFPEDAFIVSFIGHFIERKVYRSFDGSFKDG